MGTMGTTWGRRGQCGDDARMKGTMWGQQNH